MGNPLVRLEKLDDEKRGSCTLKSVLLMDFDTREDTHPHDPFDTINEIEISKWMYVKVPTFLLNMVCKKAQGLFPGKVECLGQGTWGYKVRIPCTFEQAIGHCLPDVGKQHVRFPIKPPMGEILNVVNGLFAGWVKVKLVTTNPAITHTEIACVQAEVKVDS